jgi:HIRAN domain
MSRRDSLKSIVKTKVVGVTHKNGDGSSRQRIIRKWCHPGGVLELVPEPNNPVDELAIGVWVRRPYWFLFSRRHQVGYLQAGLAEDLHDQLDAGREFSARILNVTGGGRGQNYGVNIEIEVTGAAKDA